MRISLYRFPLTVLLVVTLFYGCSDSGGGPPHVLPQGEGGFEAGPGDPVEVSKDGAVLREDPVRSPVSAENRAFAVPQDAEVMTFDYVVTVPAGNEDFLQIYIGDPSKPVFEIGGLPGRYEGTYRADVTQLRGQTVRVILSLMSGWADRGLDAEVFVQNVRCGL